MGHLVKNLKTGKLYWVQFKNKVKRGERINREIEDDLRAEIRQRKLEKNLKAKIEKWRKYREQKALEKMVEGYLYD